MSTLLGMGLSNGFVPKGSNSDSDSMPSMKEFAKPILEAITKYNCELSNAETDENSENKVQKFLARFPVTIIGGSEILYQTYRKVEKYSELNSPVMIVGESGTGKELVAKSLLKPTQKFIGINCASYNGDDRFIEADLFGVVKGAFTGAERDKPGFFETAGSGIVFLDEMHKLSTSSQAKLLRALQEKTIRRMGDTQDREIKISCRIVMGVQPNINELRAEKIFFDDLYHRISVLRIDVPTLRERPEDIEVLSEDFRRKFLKENPKIARKTFRAATWRLMEQYQWPGNIRQLQNVVERLLSNSKTNTMEPIDFIEYLEIESEKKNLSSDPAEFGS